MAKKKEWKDPIALLKSFETASHWLDFKVKMGEETKRIEAKLDEELVDEAGMSIHTLWRKMRVYIEGLEVIAKDTFGTTEGGDIILTQIGLDILARKTNNYKAVQTDFDKTNSYHDVLRSQRNYIEWLLDYPRKLIEIEQAEQDKEEAVEALTELEAIQENAYNDELN